MAEALRPLAVITGASSGIGLEWAKCCARNNYDLILADNTPDIKNTAIEIGHPGIKIEPVEADISTPEGIDKVYNAIQGRHVAALLTHMEYGLTAHFLEEDFRNWKKTLDAALTGSLYLIQKVARDMAAAKSGLILITGALGEQNPGSYHALYNGIKGFLDSFVFALRHEMQDKGITITCLLPSTLELPGLQTAQQAKDPFDLVDTGIKDMMKGETELLQGWQTFVQTALSSFAPAVASLEPETVRAQESFTPSQRSAFMNTQQRYGDNQSGGRSESRGRSSGGSSERGDYGSSSNYQQARFSNEPDTGRSEYAGAASDGSQGRSEYGRGRYSYGRGGQSGRSYSAASGGGRYEEEDENYGYASSDRSGSRSGRGGGSSGEGGYGRGGSYSSESRGAFYDSRSGERGEEEYEDRYSQSGSSSRGYGGGSSRRSEYDEDIYSESSRGRMRQGGGSRYEEEDAYSSSGQGYGRGSYGSRGSGGQGGTGSQYYGGEQSRSQRTSFGCCGTEAPRGERCGDSSSCDYESKHTSRSDGSSRSSSSGSEGSGTKSGSSNERGRSGSNRESSSGSDSGR